MNKAVSQVYRALFSSLSTTFCAAGSIFLAAGMLQSSAPVIDLQYLVQWEESFIFLGTGIASLVFGLLFLWLHSRETRDRFE